MAGNVLKPDDGYIGFIIFSLLLLEFFCNS
jgi:hypothetical protein